MPEAVCISCGESKSHPWDVCNSCKFSPGDNLQLLVKSAYLSVGRYEDRRDQDIYRIDLLKIGQGIKSGSDTYFNKSDIDRLTHQLIMVKGVKWYQPWICVGEYFVKYTIKASIVFCVIFLIAKILR